MRDIFWMNGLDRGKLAIVLRPRGGDWLEDELRRIRSAGVQILASMLEPEEADELGLNDEAKLVANAGMEFFGYPIPDRTTPSENSTFRIFAALLATRVHSDQAVAVHCRGSIGRATITTACTLIHLGWSPRDSLAMVESARGCTVPDTLEQRDWILRYKAKP
jgi:protein-tyrosine phosphatase